MGRLAIVLAVYLSVSSLAFGQRGNDPGHDLFYDFRDCALMQAARFEVLGEGVGDTADAALASCEDLWLELIRYHRQDDETFADRSDALSPIRRNVRDDTILMLMEIRRERMQSTIQ